MSDRVGWVYVNVAGDCPAASSSLINARILSFLSRIALSFSEITRARTVTYLQTCGSSATELRPARTRLCPFSGRRLGAATTILAQRRSPFEEKKTSTEGSTPAHS